MRFLFSAVMITFLWSANQHAHSASCDNQRPFVKMNYNVEAIKYDRSRSVYDLSESSNRRGHHVLGTAGGESGVSFKIEFRAKPTSLGLYCLDVTDIRAEFYTRPVVHIASSLRRGTCEYNAVLKHEREHVDILKETHRDHLGGYGRYLKEISRDIPEQEPTTVKGLQRQKKVVSDFITTHMSAYMEQEINPDLNERQAEIDTPESYMEVRAQCDNWNDKIN